ncbi:MAG: phosphate acetyltransferase [Paracoccaceae bacterium]
MTLTPIELLKSRLPAVRPVIALSEGIEPRIVAGGLAAVEMGLADIILVGARKTIEAELAGQGGCESAQIVIHDPSSSELIDDFAHVFHELRKHRGVDLEKAHNTVSNPIFYAAMLVRCGHAAGTLGGSITTTGDIVRAALQVIGMAPDAAIASSFFLMFPPTDAADGARAMVYSDCGLVIDPNAQELTSIAAASAVSCRALLQAEPRIAMLSFSTKGSASHPVVDKVAQAANTLREQHPELCMDGEFQFDAAFVPSVGARKAPDSPIAGQANVMIFPNLDAGNIAYKISQRLGRYAAIGPILQGLNQPANDLSRGCSAQDVTEMIAVTVLQGLIASND